MAINVQNIHIQNIGPSICVLGCDIALGPSTLWPVADLGGGLGGPGPPKNFSDEV